MKRTGIIFLLSVFLFNIIGYFIIFGISQFQLKEAIRKDIRNGVIDHSVIEVVISRTELSDVNWIENDEFEFNNERYDVVAKKETRGATTFYCINDEIESALFSHLDTHIKNNVSCKSHSGEASKLSIDNVVKILNDPHTEIRVVSFSQGVIYSPYISNYRFSLVKSTFQPPELA